MISSTLLNLRLSSAKKVSASNRYGFENASFYLEKEFKSNPIRARIKYRLKRLLNFVLIRFWFYRQLSNAMNNLDHESQDLLVELLAYRMFGFRKVKLRTNNHRYSEMQRRIESSAMSSDSHALSVFSGLKHFDLKEFGYNIRIDYTVEGIMMDFVLEQYACHSGKTIQAMAGDIVLDVGGCWGDTALYFADKVGRDGHVYSFEFIPRNVKVFQCNVDLNPEFRSRISLVENPVFSKSNLSVYYLDKGAGSKVSMKPLKHMTGTVMTLAIDDFVSRNQLSKIDFIKMDIEGAELAALEGARKTIQRFKPKLAIAIYHSIGDMGRIPNWILDLNLGYTIHLGHYTIFEDETVCFASVE